MLLSIFVAGAPKSRRSKGTGPSPDVIRSERIESRAGSREQREEPRAAGIRAWPCRCLCLLSARCAGIWYLGAGSLPAQGVSGPHTTKQPFEHGPPATCTVYEYCLPPAAYWLQPAASTLPAGIRQDRTAAQLQYCTDAPSSSILGASSEFRTPSTEYCSTVALNTTRSTGSRSSKY